MAAHIHDERRPAADPVDLSIMLKRTFVIAVCAAILVSCVADARSRTRRFPPPPPAQGAPALPDQSPDELPEPQRGTYQVLHAFGKA